MLVDDIWWRLIVVTVINNYWLAVMIVKIANNTNKWTNEFDNKWWLLELIMMIVGDGCMLIVDNDGQ